MGELEGICGIVLAAGAGTRFGGPKALARASDRRPWVQLAVDALTEGGCDEVVVVLGAEAAAAAELVPKHARTEVAADWAGGLSHSLRAGLAAAAGARAAVVIPVDTPELPATAVARVIAAAPADPADALVRAEYGGRPGHPVLLGARHWRALAAELTGDVGAGPYLARNGALAVECGDLWSGLDRDRP
jgi:CTP:molybdopterin cytidylyltransferase MocA